MPTFLLPHRFPRQASKKMIKSEASAVENFHHPWVGVPFSRCQTDSKALRLHPASEFGERSGASVVATSIASSADANDPESTSSKTSYYSMLCPLHLSCRVTVSTCSFRLFFKAQALGESSLFSRASHKLCLKESTGPSTVIPYRSIWPCKTKMCLCIFAI